MAESVLFFSWNQDNHGKMRVHNNALGRQHGKVNRYRQGEGGYWSGMALGSGMALIFAWSTADNVELAGFSEKADRFFLLSNKCRDRVVLLEIETSTGAKKVLFNQVHARLSEQHINTGTALVSGWCN